MILCSREVHEVKELTFRWWIRCGVNLSKVGKQNPVISYYEQVDDAPKVKQFTEKTAAN